MCFAFCFAQSSMQTALNTLEMRNIVRKVTQNSPIFSRNFSISTKKTLKNNRLILFLAVYNLSGKRCRIRILKSLYVNRIAKEPFRCTTLWSCAKDVGLLAVVLAFQYSANIAINFQYSIANYLSDDITFIIYSL